MAHYLVSIIIIPIAVWLLRANNRHAAAQHLIRRAEHAASSAAAARATSFSSISHECAIILAVF